MKIRNKKAISNITFSLIILVVIVLCTAAYFVIDNLVIKSNNTAGNNNGDVNVNQNNEPLYTMENFPKIDASLATQPLTDAIIANFTGLNKSEIVTNYSNTHPAYVKLINDEVDLIVVTEPSKEELQLAKDKGIELEVMPVVKEGFVFYVNSKNPVNSLTKEQIQSIYSGEIKNWKQVGGEDKAITPYQRPTNSGSQTGMLSLVMKDKKLMTPKKENLIQTMAEIVNLVSQYNNDVDAIGYSYYYYAKTMYETIDNTVASNIKFISVDGIEPSNENIQSGLYPYTTAYYIVINKADGENSPARILANQLLSARGQQVAEDVGYVPVK